MTKPAILAVAALLLALTAGLAGVALWRFWRAATNAYPTYVQLYPGACQALRNAPRIGVTGAAAAAFPCSFEGYFFPAGQAGQYAVVYGVSDNIRGQCLLIALDQLDPTATAVRPGDGQAIAKSAVPPACAREYRFAQTLVARRH